MTALNEAGRWPAAPAATPIPRVDVLGVGVSAITMETAVAEILRWRAEGERHYVCVTGVHGIMESFREPGLRAIHNASGLTTPDGMPAVWSAHRAGYREVTRVYGPDLMLELCARSVGEGLSHFLYGGGPGTAERLRDTLCRRFPGLDVAGVWTPPFRPLTPEEDREVVDAIAASGADIVWVGLSTPKQERWMASHVGRVPAAALIGVGAAFDIIAGNVPQAPVWMQQRGLEWLFRLSREPRRLWRRYLRNNPRFVYEVLRRPPRPMTSPPTSTGDGRRLPS